jgi:galactokinase/mevalonate kinase-like predicted kinase
MQIRLMTGIIDTQAQADALEKQMNRFLEQHGSDVIESVQMSCASGGGGIGASSTRAVGLIAYESKPHSKKKEAKKKGKK